MKLNTSPRNAQACSSAESGQFEACQLGYGAIGAFQLFALVLMTTQAFHV